MTAVIIPPSVSIPLEELRFIASRSGGPGGQNVNRVATKVELCFDIDGSPSLNDAQRELVRHSLGRRIDTKGILHIAVQESRSQWKNKQLAIERFRDLLTHALKPAKKRKRTVATVSSKEKRLKAKKLRSARKKMRLRDFDD